MESYKINKKTYCNYNSDLSGDLLIIQKSDISGVTHTIELGYKELKTMLVEIGQKEAIRKKLYELAEGDFIDNIPEKCLDTVLAELCVLETRVSK